MPYFIAKKTNKEGGTFREIYICADSIADAEKALVDRGIDGYLGIKYYAERKSSVPNEAIVLGAPEFSPEYVVHSIGSAGNHWKLIFVLAAGICLGLVGNTIVTMVLANMLSG
ncbi:MAG: hypothetical protein COB69_09795 [Phycisphaera sp.]|nr:MAG: hypothetical protein COB69_09795 [Phycisphaera sp.]